MDVTQNAGPGGPSADVVQDPVGARCQKLFQDFLESFRSEEGGEDGPKYLQPARELVKPERNTLVVSLKDVEQYNANLSGLILDDYYRLHPFLCAALKNYVHDRTENTLEKDYYVSFVDVDAQFTMRDLSTVKIGEGETRLVPEVGSKV